MRSAQARRNENRELYRCICIGTVSAVLPHFYAAITLYYFYFSYSIDFLTLSSTDKWLETDYKPKFISELGGYKTNMEIENRIVQKS